VLFRSVGLGRASTAVIMNLTDEQTATVLNPLLASLKTVPAQKIIEYCNEWAVTNTTFSPTHSTEQFWAVLNETIREKKFFIKDNLKTAINGKKSADRTLLEGSLKMPFLGYFPERPHVHDKNYYTAQTMPTNDISLEHILMLTPAMYQNRTYSTFKRTTTVKVAEENLMLSCAADNVRKLAENLGVINIISRWQYNNMGDLFNFWLQYFLKNTVDNGFFITANVLVIHSTNGVTPKVATTLSRFYNSVTSALFWCVYSLCLQAFASRTTSNDSSDHYILAISILFCKEFLDPTNQKITAENIAEKYYELLKGTGVRYRWGGISNSDVELATPDFMFFVPQMLTWHPAAENTFNRMHYLLTLKHPNLVYSGVENTLLLNANDSDILKITEQSDYFKQLDNSKILDHTVKTIYETWKTNADNLFNELSTLHISTGVVTPMNMFTVISDNIQQLQNGSAPAINEPVTGPVNLPTNTGGLPGLPSTTALPPPAPTTGLFPAPTDSTLPTDTGLPSNSLTDVPFTDATNDMPIDNVPATVPDTANSVPTIRDIPSDDEQRRQIIKLTEELERSKAEIERMAETQEILAQVAQIHQTDKHGAAEILEQDKRQREALAAELETRKLELETLKESNAATLNLLREMYNIKKDQNAMATDARQDVIEAQERLSQEREAFNREQLRYLQAKAANDIQAVQAAADLKVEAASIRGQQDTVNAQVKAAELQAQLARYAEQNKMLEAKYTELVAQRYPEQVKQYEEDNRKLQSTLQKNEMVIESLQGLVQEKKENLLREALRLSVHDLNDPAVQNMIQDGDVGIETYLSGAPSLQAILKLISKGVARPEAVVDALYQAGLKRINEFHMDVDDTNAQEDLETKKRNLQRYRDKLSVFLKNAKQISEARERQIAVNPEIVEEFVAHSGAPEMMSLYDLFLTGSATAGAEKRSLFKDELKRAMTEILTNSIGTSVNQLNGTEAQTLQKFFNHILETNRELTTATTATLYNPMYSNLSGLYTGVVQPVPVELQQILARPDVTPHQLALWAKKGVPAAVMQDIMRKQQPLLATAGGNVIPEKPGLAARKELTNAIQVFAAVKTLLQQGKELEDIVQKDPKLVVKDKLKEKITKVVKSKEDEEKEKKKKEEEEKEKEKEKEKEMKAKAAKRDAAAMQDLRDDLDRETKRSALERNMMYF